MCIRDRSKALFTWMNRTIEGELSGDCRSTHLKITMPEAPGNYVLTAKVTFADGYEEERMVTLRVRGRAKRPVTKRVIAEGDEVTKINVLSAADSDYVLQHLSTALKQFLEKVSSLKVTSKDEDKDRAVSLKVDVSVSKDNINNILRMVRALSNLTQKVNLTIMFEEPVKATADLINQVKQRNVIWEILEEERT